MAVSKVAFPLVVVSKVTSNVPPFKCRWEASVNVISADVLTAQVPVLTFTKTASISPFGY